MVLEILPLLHPRKEITEERGLLLGNMEPVVVAEHQQLEQMAQTVSEEPVVRVRHLRFKELHIIGLVAVAGVRELVALQQEETVELVVGAEPDVKPLLHKELVVEVP